MPTWSGILEELGRTTDGTSPPDFDRVRRNYMAALRQHTGRSTILYASGWLQKDDTPDHLITIGDEDIQALMEVTSGLGSGSGLDLILHSPGGSLEAAGGTCGLFAVQVFAYSRLCSQSCDVRSHYDLLRCRRNRSR